MGRGLYAPSLHTVNNWELGFWEGKSVELIACWVHVVLCWQAAPGWDLDSCCWRVIYRRVPSATRAWVTPGSLMWRALTAFSLWSFHSPHPPHAFVAARSLVHMLLYAQPWCYFEKCLWTAGPFAYVSTLSIGPKYLVSAISKPAFDLLLLPVVEAVIQSYFTYYLELFPVV